MISIIVPNFFDVISLLEDYHPRKAMRWMLVRMSDSRYVSGDPDVHLKTFIFKGSDHAPEPTQLVHTNICLV